MQAGGTPPGAGVAHVTSDIGEIVHVFGTDYGLRPSHTA